MKKFFLTILISFLAVTSANTQTKIEVGIAGDFYYATDNDKSVKLEERPFTSANIFKDRFGTNNVVLNASVTNADWRTNLAVATFGDFILPEEINLGLRLFEKLWITGGLYANWDDDYTFEKWFTENSLTYLRNMGSPYVSWGLEYSLFEDIVLGAGIMNTGFIDIFEHYNKRLFGINLDNNHSKSFYAKVNMNNLYEDWSFALSYLTGNDEDDKEQQINITEIYATAGGTIIDNLEAQIAGKYFRDVVNNDSTYDINTITFSASLRYRFHEKFAAGIRFSYLTEGKYGPIFDKTPDDDDPYNTHPGNNSGIDFNILCEYNPSPFTYLRLEGGVLSLSNSEKVDYAKRFWNGKEDVSTRLSIAISMGFRFGLFQTEIK